MSPIRFLILCGLCYLLFRLLFGKKTPRRQDHRTARQVYQDSLVEDPVCHTYIPQKQAITVTSGGQSLYFCSTRCRDQFLENSNKQQGEPK